MYTAILQAISNIERVSYREVNSRGQHELNPKSDVQYREASAIKCMLNGGFVMRV